jgi:hypothetical protein
MQGARRNRRDWSIAVAASVAIHLVMPAFVRFAPVPSAAEAVDATPVARSTGRPSRAVSW